MTSLQKSFDNLYDYTLSYCNSLKSIGLPKYAVPKFLDRNVLYLYVNCKHFSLEMRTKETNIHFYHVSPVAQLFYNTAANELLYPYPVT